MRSRYGAHEPGAAHFITSTVVGWLPVFTKASRCDVLVESLKFCREHKGLTIYGWVIMENHLHAIVAADDLSRVMTDFKRHTARRLFEMLEGEKCDWLLNQFAYLRARHKVESDHQFWQEGFHPQAIADDRMMEQKLDYLHAIPWRVGWWRRQSIGAIPRRMNGWWARTR